MENNIERLEDGWFFHDHAWMLLYTILKEIREIIKQYTFYRMLDFGAGSGFAAAVIKAALPDMDMFIYEPNKEANFYHQKRNLNILNYYSFLNDFDYHIILCSHVLEHIENPIEILKTISEKAKHLILIVPDNAGTDIDSNHKHIFNRVSFKKLIDDNINYKRMKYYPLYHPYINNLVAVIDL